MKIERLPKLRVSIIDKCQLKCVFCGGNDTHMENFQPIYMNKDKISYDQLIKIIKIYLKVGGKYVQFTGGEPLLYNRILDLTKEIVKLGGLPEINTNGIALTETVARKLSESGLHVIKISIPSFNKEKYKETTGVDCLEHVLNNIKTARQYLNVRINTVALQSHKDEIELAINTCRKLNVNQLLFLELLYYYDIKDDSKIFFKNEYVNILKEFAPIIEEKIHGKFKQFDFYTEYENSLHRCVSSVDGFEVYIKQANKTLRTRQCDTCSHFCQEGIYELRLSTGGYLSFCNVTNAYGFDVSQSNEQEIEHILKGYLNTFSNGYIDQFETFLEKHSLK